MTIKLDGHIPDQIITVAQCVAAEIDEVYGTKRKTFALEEVNGITLQRSLSAANEIMFALTPYIRDVIARERQRCTEIARRAYSGDWDQDAAVRCIEDGVILIPNDEAKARSGVEAMANIPDDILKSAVEHAKRPDLRIAYIEGAVAERKRCAALARSEIAGEVIVNAIESGEPVRRCSVCGQPAGVMCLRDNCGGVL